MRTSFISGSITAELFEVVGGEPRFIGSLDRGEKLIYETMPGSKVFMAYGVAADFMLGRLLGGRTYYVIVRPNWGSGGMIPTPIRTDGSTGFNTSSPDFQSWVTETRVVNTAQPKTKARISTERHHYGEVYEEYWLKFQTKTPEQKLERTLQPGDGIASDEPH